MTCSKNFGRLFQAGCLGLIGMLAVAGCGGSESPKKPDSGPNFGDGGPPVSAALNVTPSSLNLGNLEVNATGLGTITVTNTGKGTSGPITVTGSAGITATGCGAALAPSGSCTLTVVVAPTAVGAFSGTVSISASPGAITPLVVAVIAQVTPPGMFTVSPGTIDLGYIAVGTPAPRQTITVTAALAISDLTFASNGPDVAIDRAASTCTATLAAKASCTLAVNFVAATAGTKSEGVVISAGGANGKVVTVPISAVAQAPAKLVINPSTAQTIAVAAGNTSSPISFIVANAGDVATGTVSVTLGGAAPASFGVTSTCLVLAQLASCNVSVVYKPAANATAAEAATLIVTDTGPGASSVQVALNGTPFGVTDLEITSTVTDLGTVLVGSTGTSAVFTVTNKGDTASGALTVGVSSPEFVITNDTCTASLPKGGTCAVSIALKPGTPGPKNASLTVTGAANPTKPAVKGITGTGTTGPNLVATPSALDFATVRVNKTGTAQTVTVRNAGGSATGALSFTRGGNFAAFPLTTNTCSAALAPAATCTFTVNFAPTEAKSETASYTVTDGASSALVTVSGTGLPESGISVSPSPVSACAEPDLNQNLSRAFQGGSRCFATTVVGGSSPTIVFTLTADSTLPNGLADTGALTVAMGGTNPTEFTIVDNGCKTPLLAGAACPITVSFTPTATGLRQASLNVTTANGGADSATLQGTGLSVIEIRPLDTEDPLDATKKVSGLDFGQVPVLGDVDEKALDYMVIVRGPNTTTSFTSQVLTTLTDPTQPADFMYYGYLTNPCNTSANDAATLNFQTKAYTGGNWYNWSSAIGVNVFTCTFSVRFYPQSTKGDKKATLTATGTGPATDTKEITGTATGALTFEWLSPPDFGSTWQVGESSNTDTTLSTVVSLNQDNKLITLVNHSTTTDLGPASLTMGGANPDQFVIVRDFCTTLTLTHGAVAASRCEVGLAFAPTSAGLKTAVLTANAGTETTSVTMTGGATDPFNITITPDQYVAATNNVHDFGTVSQESNGTWHAFTITNPAGSPRSAQVTYDLDQSLNTPAFNLANGNNHAFGTCGGTGTTTLAAGQNCTFWVQFKPTSTHAVSGMTDRLEAWVEAIDQAKGDAAAAKVHAVGKVGSVLSIAPATYTFPDTPQGTVSAPVTLTVTNNGSSTTPVTLDITPNLTLAPFAVDQNTGCAGGTKQLAAGATCPLVVTFIGQGAPALAPEKALIVSAVGYTGAAVVTKLNGTTVAPAQLEAVGFGAPQTINLGGVRIGSSSGDVTLTFKNTGSAPTSSLNYFWGTGAANVPDSEFIIVNESTTGCAGKTALLPGATCTVSVHFTPATLTAQPHDKTFKLSAVNGGEVNLFTFTARSLNNTSSVYIGISGGVNAFFTFPNSTPTTATTFPSQVFQIVNGTGASISDVLSIDSTANFTLITSGADAGSAPCANPVPASSSCTFGVRFIPVAPWMATTVYRHAVVSLGVGAQLGVFGRVQSPAVLTLTPAQTAVPDPYNFGQVVIGGTNPTRAFTITNTGESASAALTVATTGAAYSHAGACDGATLAAGASCIGSFSVNPGSVAVALPAGTLTASATGAVGASVNLNAVAVRTTTLTLDVSTVSFPATPVGSSASVTRSVVITNAAGSQTSGLLTLSLADATNFSIVSTGVGPGSCPLAGDPLALVGLAGSASCTVQVAFKPLTLGTGTFSTTLIVNASPGNTQTVNISGTAVSALKTNPATPINSAGSTHRTIGTALSITVYLEGDASISTERLTTTITGGNHMIVEDQCVTTKLTGGDSCVIKVVYLGGALDTPLKTSTLTINGGLGGNTATVILNSTTPPAL